MTIPDHASSLVNDGARVTDSFTADMEYEAVYQRARWGEAHDADKSDADWFWLVGWLVGKVMYPGASVDKKRHRLRAAATALMMWDRQIEARR